MTHPVTRGELRAEIAALEERLDGRFKPLEAASAKLLTEMSQVQRDVSQLKGDVSQLKGDVSQLKGDVSQLKAEMVEMRAEMASYFRAIQEDNRKLFVVLDDKYKDLPPRVSRLEETVYAPKPPRRARGR